MQRRAIWVLSLGQVLGGLAFGATISLGAVLAAEHLGRRGASPGSLPRSSPSVQQHCRRAPRRGRATARAAARRSRIGMATAPSLGVGLVILAGGAALLPRRCWSPSRSSAPGRPRTCSRASPRPTSSTDASRARDLSIVVWATTIGAVLGPNLVGPGRCSATASGCRRSPARTSSRSSRRCSRIALYLIALRPDPLLLAQRLVHAARRGGDSDRPRRPPCRGALRDLHHGRRARRHGLGDGDDPGAPSCTTARRSTSIVGLSDQPARRRDVRPLARLRHPRRPHRSPADHPHRAGAARRGARDRLHRTGVDPCGHGRARPARARVERIDRRRARRCSPSPQRRSCAPVARAAAT